MPLKHTRYFKTSSLQGLSLFLYLSVIAFYFSMFRYGTEQISDILKSINKKSFFSNRPALSADRQLIFCINSGKAVPILLDFRKSSIQKSVSVKKQVKHLPVRQTGTLQNTAYSKKHLNYTQDILKSRSNILKSTQKLLKAREIHSTRLLFTALSIELTN